jgi:hypothetical protein
MRPAPTEWWKQIGERCREEADGWTVCSGLSLCEAELLLDWLEANGIAERETSFGAEGATVRWRG